MHRQTFAVERDVSREYLSIRLNYFYPVYFQSKRLSVDRDTYVYVYVCVSGGLCNFHVKRHILFIKCMQIFQRYYILRINITNNLDT